MFGNNEATGVLRQMPGLREVISVQPLAGHCLTSLSTQPAALALSRSVRALG